MTNRREILQEIQNRINQEGILPVNKGDRKAAQAREAEARLKYEEALRDNLLYQLSMYYRVAIFGSARLQRRSTEFKFITDLARALVESRDVDIVTGGGPGIMEAANLGARLAISKARGTGIQLRAKNFGESIRLPTEQASNEHLDYEKRHPEFSTRLQAFLDSTHAVYNAPGGIGSL